MPRPSHPSWSAHLSNIWWVIQKMHLSSSTVTSSLLGPNILLSTLFSNTPQHIFRLHSKNQLPHPHKTAAYTKFRTFESFKPYNPFVLCCMLVAIMKQTSTTWRFCAMRRRTSVSQSPFMFRRSLFPRSSWPKDCFYRAEFEAVGSTETFFSVY
jgi:hypothetical protein